MNIYKPIPDDVPYPYNKAWCQNFYWEVSTVSAGATWCTIAIIVCAILLEIVGHISFESREATKKSADEEEAVSFISIEQPPLVSEQPQSGPEQHPEPRTEEQQHDNETSISKHDESGSTSWCISSPRPETRATRLAFAIILYAITLGTFISRIHDATSYPHIDSRCRPYISAPPPNWTAIIFLNIIPFICATFAFLRALVDCVLVRWNSGLVYNFDGEGWLWAPCMPFLAVSMLGYMAFECLKVPIAWIMGDWEISICTAKAKGKKKVEEVEMDGEEAQGLVAGFGEENEDADSADGLPAYDQIVGLGMARDEGKGGNMI